jgi:ABC-2 type transport system permease protein
VPLLGAALVLHLDVPTTVGGWALVPVSVALAAVMGFCVRTLIGASAFWTPDFRGVYSLALPLIWFLSGFMIPVEYFPRGLREVAEAGPLAAMLTAPVRVVTGRGTGGALLLQVVWVVALLLACRAVLAAGERRWVVAGG